MASAIKLSKLTKKFGKKVAVDSVSLSVEHGEIFGFLGPNGAGKTTTIRLIMDFIRPSSGSVKLFGKEVGSNNEALHGKVGFLSADSMLYPQWNAKQHFAYVKKIRPTSVSNELLLAEEFDLDMSTKYHRLSSGNKQKLSLILALMHDPDLLILDEPTRGLDPLLQQAIYKKLQAFRAKGGAVFMSSHNLAEVEHICDRVGIIRDGSLVASETMQSLRQMHVHEIHVTFRGNFIKEVFEKPNVVIKSVTKRELIAHVQGDLNQFLAAVAKHSVADIEITHVSLEDMFMRFYQ